MSKEVNTMFSLLTIFFALRNLMPGIYRRLQLTSIQYFTMGAELDDLSQTTLRYLFMDGAMLFASTVLPLLLIAMAASVFITMAQTQMLFSTESLKFKGDRLNPINGLKKLFSMRSIVELLKAMVKIVILGYIIYIELSRALPRVPRLMDVHVVAVAAFAGELILAIVWRAGAVFVVLAVADYFYQWWEYEKNLRMSKQEIKDEFKELEGDPQTRGRQRARRMEAARRRMMEAVPTADVVVRNPTHYAVALKYEPEKHLAPVVVAKGMDHLAMRIIRLAEEHEVYIVENKPLAKSLFDEVELDREIPETYYQAIAEVLAFVFDLRERDMGADGERYREAPQASQATAPQPRQTQTQMQAQAPQRRAQ